MISVIRRADKPAGFTFIELLISVTIMLILIGVSLPSLKKALDNFGIENYARNISYLGRYLQASSISEGKIYCMKVLPAENKIFPFFIDGNNLQQKLSARMGREHLLPQGVKFLNPQDEEIVYFYPDGTAQGGNISFANSYNSKISLLINGATGEIAIEQEK